MTGEGEASLKILEEKQNGRGQARINRLITGKSFSSSYFLYCTLESIVCKLIEYVGNPRPIVIRCPYLYNIMDGFSSYNQIHIKKEDQHKTNFICPWGRFTYRKMPFGLENVGANFQRAMSCYFHDIKKIVKVYLDELITKTRRRY